MFIFDMTYKLINMLDQMRFLSLSWKILCFIKVGKSGDIGCHL
jgi:hypothetical protein